MTEQHTHTIPLFEREENVLLLSSRLYMALQRHDFVAVQDVVEQFFTHWDQNRDKARLACGGRYRFVYRSLASAMEGAEKLKQVIGASGLQ